MIKAYNGYKAERRTTREPLPAGGYVAKIMDARTVKYDWGEQLIIAFDIAEGERKGFFAADYRANTSDSKKWRGSYRIIIPDENNQYFDSQRAAFNDLTACVEESNAGYHWAWDEKTLKGKTIGVLFRNKEWEWEGRTGWTTECGGVTTADDIRQGSYKPLKDKPLKAKAASTSYAAAFTTTVEDDSDFPF